MEKHIARGSKELQHTEFALNVCRFRSSRVQPPYRSSRESRPRPKVSRKRAFNGLAVSFRNMQKLPSPFPTSVSVLLIIFCCLSSVGRVSLARNARHVQSKPPPRRAYLIPLGQNLRVNRVRVIHRRLFSAATKPLKGLKPGKNERSEPSAGKTPRPLAEVFHIRLGAL